MAVYDCFQYFNEDHVVDLRLNILDNQVDYFVISESTRTHQGRRKKLNFNIDNFPKFKKKIRYLVAEYNKEITFNIHTGGESPIEQHQRNFLIEGIKDANDEDLIILSDSDEIPDLSKLNLIKKNKKFIAFSQKMFMYKLNIQNINESNWIGSKIIKKKNLTSMQELRNLKFKRYPFWRLDKRHLQIIDGGWHFSFLQKPEDIIKKITSFSHGEFNKADIIDKQKIEAKIREGKDIFNRKKELKLIQIDDTFPKYIKDNLSKFREWIN